MRLRNGLLHSRFAFISAVCLLAGLLVLLSSLAPDKVRSPGVVRHNYEEGIEATALFYTEIDFPME